QFLVRIDTGSDNTSGVLEAATNTYTLSGAQIDDLIARQLYLNISSGSATTPEIRAQFLPEATAYFIGSLSGASQTPTVRSTATGQTIAEVHGSELILSGSFNGLESDFNTSIGTHIHEGLAGQNGEVNYALITDVSNSSRDGAFLASNNAFDYSVEQLEQLFTRGQYVNIHSIDNPSGAIRGQLLPLANGHFTTTLSSINQVNPLSSAGAGSVKFDLLGNMLTVSGSVMNLGSSTTDDSAMLFAGEVGKIGSLALPLVMVANNTNGLLRAEDNQFVLSDEQVATLRAESMYVNVSTNGNVTGEVRGQVLSEPNFFPTGNMRFSMPVDGDFFVAAGDPTALFTTTWSAGTDDNELYYIFQTSEFLDFRTVEEELILTDAPGEFQYRLSELDSFLMNRNVAVGDTIARYYRMPAPTIDCT
ncbi:MAG: CHRD domain-containing protein, partial [Bacteroidota bacterium]